MLRSRLYGVLRRTVNVLASGLLFIAVLSVPAAAAEPLRILALGDSLTAGYGLPAEHGFTVRLQARLHAAGHAVEIENAGVSGDTSAGGSARLDWALASKPNAAIVEFGANDGLRGLDPRETHRNLDALLTKLSARNLPVLLTGMLAPPNMGREYGDEFRQVFTQLAADHEVLFYPFFLDGVAGEADLNQRDGMHPTLEGVEIIITRMLPSILALIERAGGRSRECRGPGMRPVAE